MWESGSGLISLGNKTVINLKKVGKRHWCFKESKGSEIWSTTKLMLTPGGETNGGEISSGPR